MTATPRTRRAVLAASAASAGALALSACGDDSDNSGSSDAGSSGSSGSSGDNEGEGGEDDQPAEPGSVAPLADVPVGEATVARTPDGQDALLFRPDEATVVAFGAVCTHQGCAVEPDGVELHCPCHNSVFDAATGEVLSGPAGAPLPAIRVRIEGEQIVTE
jgi:Rieske Fe-S protein